MITIDSVVAAYPFGKASAARRGRHPYYPYIPVVDHGKQEVGVYRTRTEQLLGLAYATREEAVSFAQRTINARRAGLRQKLLDPRYRALRAQHGLT